MKHTLKALLTTTLLSMPALYAADEFSQTGSTPTPTLNVTCRTTLDAREGSFQLQLGNASFTKGEIEKAIEHYKHAWRVGSAFQAGEAAGKLSEIKKFPLPEKIAMLEEVVSRKEPQWAYNAACALAPLDSAKGIAAFQKVVDMREPMWACLASIILLEMQDINARVAAISAFKQTVAMEDSTYSWEAARHLGSIDELGAEEIATLAKIILKIDNILKKETRDLNYLIKRDRFHTRRVLEDFAQKTGITIEQLIENANQELARKK